MNRKALIAKLSFVVFLPTVLAAQGDRTDHTTGHKHLAHYPHYRFIDLGTLGGPHSYGPVNGLGSRLLNNAGVVASYADTPAEHPDAPDFCGVPNRGVLDQR